MTASCLTTRLGGVAGGLCALCLAAMPVVAQQAYTVTDFDTFGHLTSDATGINDRGQVVGTGPASGGAFVQTIWYVKADAGGQNNGTSWEDAFTELQSALHVAKKGDEIWVAAGKYLPDYDVNSGKHTLDREASFRLRNRVAIYGGFDGTEKKLEDRAGLFDDTILSGDLLGDDGPDFENNDENSYHVTKGSGTRKRAVLDGFTITAGNPDEYGDGGGMYNIESNPTLTNCTFSGNWAYDGGGMFNKESSPTLTNCTFSDNWAEIWGGGMWNYRSSSPTLTECTFNGNVAGQDGGGMDNRYNSSPTLTNCIFSGNWAERWGGGMSNLGGSSPALTECTFSDNSADWHGGGMFNKESSPTLTDCTFSGNSARDDGGGMSNWYESSPTLTNCTFSGNSTSYSGGGMSNYESTPTLTNCTFSDNSADDGGGGMYNYGDDSPTLANCILWGDTPNEIGGSANPVVTFSDVQGGWPGEGNIDKDPRFVTGPLGDFYLSQKRAGQDKNSPCVNKGDGTAKELSLKKYTTRTDHKKDRKRVDMGYHYPRR